MAKIEPPRPLTQREFEAAIALGKTSMKEIDPEFYKWYKETGDYLAIGKVALRIGLFMLLIVLCFIIKGII